MIGCHLQAAGVALVMGVGREQSRVEESLVSATAKISAPPAA